MDYFSVGSENSVITEDQARDLLNGMLDRLGRLERVLIVPPDYTRCRSWAGELTVLLYQRLKEHARVEILPALGTHAPMSSVGWNAFHLFGDTAETQDNRWNTFHPTESTTSGSEFGDTAETQDNRWNTFHPTESPTSGSEMGKMFPGIPKEVFRVHDWRNGLVHLGDVPSEYVSEVSGGKVDYPIRCEINRLLVEEKWDRIFSIGQLVPHEVVGIANHNKNILIGTGGRDTINRTHYLGAVCNMETIMGRADTPVRRVLNYMDREFLKGLPISYVLTVRKRDSSGELTTCGLYAGDDDRCFLRGSELCRKVNVELLDAPLRKVVVYLNPEEFQSTWLGNKAIYRTRLAIADGGELIIIAPGVKTFGEDSEIDRLIRKYGYQGADAVVEHVRKNPDLQENLSAAAHLIHGSSEGRFRVVYCPGRLTQKEIESVGYTFADIRTVSERYKPGKLAEGFNTMPDGEVVYFISNPGLGLWTTPL